MIEINGKQFAKNDNEWINTLFDAKRGETAFGFYKRLKRQIKLFDHQKKQIGIINAYGVLGSVTILPDGKKWYSYADITGLGKVKYSEACKLASKLAIDSILLSNGERKYQYK